MKIVKTNETLIFKFFGMKKKFYLKQFVEMSDEAGERTQLFICGTPTQHESLFDLKKKIADNVINYFGYFEDRGTDTYLICRSILFYLNLLVDSSVKQTSGRTVIFTRNLVDNLFKAEFYNCY